MAKQTLEQATEEIFLQSLKRLSHFDGPLQNALRQLHRIVKDHGLPVPEDIKDCLRLVIEDSQAVRVGGTRVAKQLRQLRAFTHTSALINSSLDLDEVLHGVIDAAISLTEAERAYLVLYEEEGGELVIRAARNWDKESLSRDHVNLSRTIIKDAIERQEPIITSDAQDDERFMNNFSVIANELRSIVCIPLLERNKVIGVLYADNRLEEDTFGEESISILTTFSNHAAIAIENARLHSRVKADLASAKLEIQRLQISVDRQSVSQQVNEITESDYFKRILKLSQEARKKYGKARG